MQLAHVRETLYRFGEVFNGFVCIAVFDAVPDTVLDVSLQNNLSAAVQGGFCGIDLRQNIFAGDILVDHAVAHAQLIEDIGIAARTAAQLFADIGHVHLQLFITSCCVMILIAFIVI